MAPRAFISYNHEDHQQAERLGRVLEQAGIQVTVDHIDMRPGEEIATFIDESIRSTDAMVSLISRNSLRSQWVAREILRAFEAGRFASKRYLPCYLDTDFFAPGFVTEETTRIDAELEKLDAERDRRGELKQGTADIDDDIKRLRDLRNGLPEIVHNLKDGLTVDLTEEAFDHGAAKLIAAIKAIGRGADDESASAAAAPEVATADESGGVEAAEGAEEHATTVGPARTARLWRRTIAALAVALAAVFLGIVGRGLFSPAPPGARPAPPVQPTASPSTPPPFGIVAGDLSLADLQRLVGQLFIVGIAGPAEFSRDAVASQNPGGVLLLDRNVCCPGDDARRQRGELMGLTDSLQAASHESSGLPLIIAVDQEGGNTQILDAGSGIGTEMPAPMALGAIRSLSKVRDAGRVVGEELVALGINVNLAPSADVNTNSRNDLIRDRSFGGDGDFVGGLATAFMEAQLETGIVPVAKHFPGHGSTEEGIETPGVPESALRSWEGAISPFRQLVNAGVPGVMTSHFNPVNLTQTVVTFDSRIIALLRRTDQSAALRLPGLGFTGLVVADDLDIPALTYREDESPIKPLHRDAVLDVVTRAFDAGHDMLILGNVLPNSATDGELVSSRRPAFRKGIRIQDLEYIVDGLRSHIFDDPQVAQERVEQFRASLERILRFKEQLRVVQDGRSIEERIEVLDEMLAEHQEHAEALFRSSFSVLSSADNPPSMNLGTNDRAFLFFHTRMRPATLQSYRANPAAYEQQKAKELAAWHVPGELASRLEARGVQLSVELGVQYPPTTDFDERAQQISASVAGADPKFAFIVIHSVNHAQQLVHTLHSLDEDKAIELRRVVVIVAAHPNLITPIVESDLLAGIRERVNFVFAYSGGRLRARVLADLLTQIDSLRDLEDTAELPVRIPDWHNPTWQLRQ